jgi:hypothetical protein
VFRLPTLLTEEQVDSVLSLTHTHTSAFGWTTRRHDHYPTTDVPVKTVSNLHSFLASSGYYQRLLTTLAGLYNLRSSDMLRLDDHFVVKYEAGAGLQNSLSRHRDGSEFTILSYHVVLSHEVRVLSLYLVGGERATGHRELLLHCPGCPVFCVYVQAMCRICAGYGSGW